MAENQNYELSAEAMLKALKLQKDKEKLYFDLQKKMAQLQPYVNYITKNNLQFDLSMDDQIRLFKSIVLMNTIAKEICIEHGWDDEIEEVQMD